MNIIKKIIFIILIGISLSSGTITHAATISIDRSESVFAKDTAIFTVQIDTQGDNINTLEGSLSLTSNSYFEIRDISVATSRITLWPKKPSLSTSGETISFIGGIPQGIEGNNLNLFQIAVYTRESGSIVFDSKDVKYYLNDGKGTEKKMLVRKGIFTVQPERQSNSKNEIEEVLQKDTQAPDSFEIIPIKDPALYAGKRVITFSAIDRESGIDHYEVIEGDREKVRTGDTYILQEQQKKTKISVVAYDRSGNVRIEKITVPKEGINWVGIIIWVGILGILLRFKKIYLMIKKYVRHIFKN